MTKSTISKHSSLLFASLLIGLIAACFATGIKLSTEYYEHVLYDFAIKNTWPIFLFPLLAFTIITFLKRFLFQNQHNKGIKDVNETIKDTTNHLSAYKIPSHLVNGFLTVISGGSTGVEVSTVVSSAALGSITSQRKPVLAEYKNELICAGIAAGVTALFNAPLAGLLFVYEVFSKKLTNAFVLCMLTATTVASGASHLLSNEALFHFNVSEWHFYAIPYFILLGILAALNSVYLTKCVIFFKQSSAFFQNTYTRILCFSLAISILIYFIPQLYGDGYLAINHLTSNPHVMNFQIILTLSLILFIKPVITSITLSAGGDGGVFAPSLFLGAFLGAIVALLLNHFFNANVIVLNFIVVGMASVLSASIHAPFTSVFLICGLTGNFYLVIPLLIGSFVSKITAEKIVPYTVYSYPK